MSLSLIVRRADSTRPFTVTIDVPEATVGRASTCDVRLPFPVVSSHHLTLREIDGEWQVVDVGSTNGTLVEGYRLPIDRPVAVEDGMELRIVDVTIELALERRVAEGFTLAQTGTMVRQMIADALDGTDDEELALFEVVSGPGAGARAMIPDELDEGWIGSADDGVMLKIHDVTVPPKALRVYRHDDGFVVSPHEHATVLLDGEALRGPARLRSDARIVLGTVELAFYDPLEGYLDELEGLGVPPGAHGRSAPLPSPVAAVEPEVSSSVRVDAQAAPGAGAGGSSPRQVAGPAAALVESGGGAPRLGAVEIALLVASLLILAVGTGVVLLLFDLI